MKEEKEKLAKLLSNKTVIVSCSGGPDSMALLSVVNSIKDDNNLKVIVAHVNHKVREESDEEAQMVSKYAEDNNDVFELYEINEYHEKQNFHEDARKIRYAFIKDLIKKYNADYILTAHHGDDLIETILMRITRGSNIKGFTPFKEISSWENISIIRPLIHRTKKELEEYDKDNNIPYRIDKTNYSDDYTRNRFRNNIIPLMKNEEDNIHLKFLKFTEEIAKYYDYVNNKAKEELSNVTDEEGNIIVSKLIKLDDILVENILSDLITKYQLVDYLPINDNIFTNMKDTLNSQKSNALINLPNGYRFGKEYDKLVFDKNTNRVAKFNQEFVDKFENEDMIITVTDVFNKSNNTIALDLKEVKLPIRIRSRLDGDTIEVLNLKGKKKIKDIFIDSKVSKLKRDNYPIVVDSDNKVLWIPGLKKSKFAKDKDEKYDIILNCKEK